MLYIRQNATIKVPIGPVVAVGDGFTPVTTLSVSTADEAEAILHDNGTVVDISAYTFAAIATADGYYHLTLQSGISSTLGHMTIVINDDSLCLPVRAEFQVITATAWDNMFSSATPETKTVDWIGRVTGTVDNSAHTPTATVFEADDITEASPDHFVGSGIEFLTGALAQQKCRIVGYSLEGSNGRFTVTTLTEAPANNDTFHIF